MRMFIVILQMGLIITGLVLAVGVFFYAVVWVSLVVTSFFPAIGKRHRHRRWDELTKHSGREKGRK